MEFSERLSVPWWWWPVALLLVAPLGLELHLWHDWRIQLAESLVVAAAAAALLFAAGAATVTLSGERLLAGGASVPVGQLGEVCTLDPQARRAVMGPQADVRARLVTRPWIGGAVYLQVTSGPVPYWLISTRRPGTLVAAVRAAQDAAGLPPYRGA